MKGKVKNRYKKGIRKRKYNNSFKYLYCIFLDLLLSI